MTAEREADHPAIGSDDGQPDPPRGCHASYMGPTSAITWCDSGPWWWRARSRRYLKSAFGVCHVAAAGLLYPFSCVVDTLS